MFPKTQNEARTLGLKYFNTGRACVEGHYADRFVSNKRCAECVLNEYEASVAPTAKRYLEKYPEKPEPDYSEFY